MRDISPTKRAGKEVGDLLWDAGEVRLEIDAVTRWERLESERREEMGWDPRGAVEPCRGRRLTWHLQRWWRGERREAAKTPQDTAQGRAMSTLLGIPWWAIIRSNKQTNRHKAYIKFNRACVVESPEWRQEFPHHKTSESYPSGSTHGTNSAQYSPPSSELVTFAERALKKGGMKRRGELGIALSSSLLLSH